MDYKSEVEDDEGYLNEQKGEDEEKKEADLNDDSELGEEKEETKWDDIDWSEDNYNEREKTKWDDIDWSEDNYNEREKTKWDEIDWNEDFHGDRDKNEKDKNDGQNEEYNKEDYVENVESQSTSTVLTNKIEEIESDMEHQEQEEEVEIRPEEYKDDTEPIVNTDEIEFIKDVEELAEHAREIKAEDEIVEPQAEQENAAYYAEQYYEKLKEKVVIKDQDSIEEQETEELRQEVTEEFKSEESINEASKEITSTEEFEYLWGIREKLDREGKSPEEIEEVMHEAEEMYETLKNAEKLYEEQQLEKLKLVDHEDEASEEDLKEDLDRVDLIEQAVELEEKLVQQGGSQEEIDTSVEEAIETTKFEEKLEIIIEQQELEKLKLVDHEDEASEEDLKEDLDRIDLIEQAVELEEKLVQQGGSQEEIDTRVEEAIETTKLEEKLEIIIEQQELEKLKLVNHEDEASEEDLKEDFDRVDLLEQTYENVENKDNLEALKPELDAIESESEGNKDFLEESRKLVSEESDEEETEHLQELYRQETGRRPIYSRKKTNGYSQWLEQRELRSEKIKNSKSESEKIKEVKEEDWKTTLKQWIKESSEEECNAELKSELKKALESYNEFEGLTRKFMELYEKSQHEKLSEKERKRLKSLTERLQELDPIQLELLASVFFIKKYITEQYWDDFWKTPVVNRVLSKFFKHISQIYKNLKQAQKKKENSEKILRNWIEQASEEEISPELKVKLKEIAENYGELEELATMFMKLYTKEQRGKLSKHEKHELKSLMTTLQKLEPGKIELFSSIRAIKNYLNDLNFDDFSDKKSMNQILNHFFTRLSQKYKKLNKIPKSHQDIETSKEKRKKCRRCHKVLSYNKFEKYGSERGKKEGKQSYRTLCKNCRREVKSISALRKKLRLILELFGGKCNNCHTGLIFLPSFEFHHTEKEIKNLSWRKISQNAYQTLKNWAVNEKVTSLCGNCHSKEQAKYYKEFKNLILKKNLFKFSQEEIEELINVSIRNHPKFKNSKIKSKIKYQIKRWIRKRFVIEQLYNGKCIVCGLQADENLTSMIFHHRNEKQKRLVWGDLRDLDCVEILRSLISENCVCICLNCHGVLHSTFNSNIEEILKGIFTENEINKFSSDVNLILSRINNAIISFKFKLETIKFISPLKYAIDQNNIWKIKMLKIFSYLKQSEFRTKDIKSLCNNNYSNAYEIIGKLVEKEFLLRVKREGFTQNYYKFSEEGIKRVKEIQQTYELHEGLKSWDNEQITSNQRMENDDILEIYPKIIKRIIKTKGYNEFTVKELAEAIGKSTVNISRNLREKLIPNGYVKVKKSSIITKKYGSTKVYYLTDKTEIL